MEKFTQPLSTLDHTSVCGRGGEGGPGQGESRDCLATVARPDPSCLSLACWQGRPVRVGRGGGRMFWLCLGSARCHPPPYQDQGQQGGGGGVGPAEACVSKLLDLVRVGDVFFFLRKFTCLNKAVGIA